MWITSLERPLRAREDLGPLSRLVMKFGGTSVADLERIRRVARLVAAEVAAGRKVAVVVSAMAGKTNELVAWTDGAGEASQGLSPSDDEYDTVVASGEQVTAGLLAMTLRNIGVSARSWLGWAGRYPSSPTMHTGGRGSRIFRRKTLSAPWIWARSR